MKPNINLIDYTIIDCTIKITPSLVGVEPIKKPWDYKYKWDYGLRQFDNKKNHYRLNLSFIFESAKKDTFPFYISLGLMGIIENTPTEKKINGDQNIPVVTLNGLAILYGIMRSLVSDITSQCYQGRFILPTINFVDELKKRYK